MNRQKLREVKEWVKAWFRKRRADGIFWENEIRANLFVSGCLIILGCVILLSYGGVLIGLFEVPVHEMNYVLLLNLPLIALSCSLCRIYHGRRHWIKYLLCITSLAVAVGLTSTISIFVSLIMCIPILLSTRYYSRRFTIFIAVLSVIAMFISQILYGMGSMIDLNLVELPHYVTLYVKDEGLRGAVKDLGYNAQYYAVNLLRGSFAPDLLLYVIISVICAELAVRAHNMVLEQERISTREESIRAELQTATRIQASALPKIFPPFPARSDLDIYATMNPAKEVGGDFYDYYFIDDDHLAIVIADVSGKGVPAALFMMISKALINTYAGVYRTPARIAEAVNRKLCEDNEAEMFVTAWIGVVELSTGNVTAVDCGHEYPFIRHGEEGFSLLKKRKSFVLAGMETTKFREFSFHMDKGDLLFLYTDGVPEAANARQEFYGLGRLGEVLGSCSSSGPRGVLEAVHADVERFVGSADQFDDLTMVALQLT